MFSTSIHRVDRGEVWIKDDWISIRLTCDNHWADVGLFSREAGGAPALAAQMGLVETPKAKPKWPNPFEALENLRAVVAETVGQDAGRPEILTLCDTIERVLDGTISPSTLYAFKETQS